MTKATNEQLFAGAVRRARARTVAEESLPPEANAFLASLHARWSAIGRLEDYEIVKRLLVEAWTK